MRKKIFSGVFALALLATAGLGAHKSMNSNAGLSDLALNNVEALAQGEVTFPYLCRHTSADDCVNDDGYQIYGDRVW